MSPFAEDILAIKLLDVTCGADDWTDLEVFGNRLSKWLKTFLELPGGILLHNTFRRVLGLLDSKHFSAGLFRWTQTIQESPYYGALWCSLARIDFFVWHATNEEVEVTPTTFKTFAWFHSRMLLSL